MKHIFLTLSLISTALLMAAFVMGMSIDDPKVQTEEVAATVNLHMGTAMFALIAAAMVHSLALTYFMGTGRWMEETSRAYCLGESRPAESRSMKYRMMLGMSGCLVMLIVTLALGASIDSNVWKGFTEYGIAASTIHFLTASVTICLNMLVYMQEYQAISRNGQLVDEVMVEVRRMRTERGLPV